MTNLHYLVDMYGCAREKLAYVEDARKALNLAVERGRITKIGESYKQFEPYGASGVILVAESHLSLHTWVDEGIVLADVFTCGSDVFPENAVRALIDYFEPERTVVRKVYRGRDGEKVEEEIQEVLYEKG
jgi:S-adenosylmethionine decarboxylase